MKFSRGNAGVQNISLVQTCFRHVPKALRSRAAKFIKFKQWELSTNWVNHKNISNRSKHFKKYKKHTKIPSLLSWRDSWASLPPKTTAVALIPPAPQAKKYQKGTDGQIERKFQTDELQVVLKYVFLFYFIFYSSPYKFLPASVLEWLFFLSKVRHWAPLL